MIHRRRRVGWFNGEFLRDQKIFKKYNLIRDSYLPECAGYLFEMHALLWEVGE